MVLDEWRKSVEGMNSQATAIMVHELEAHDQCYVAIKV